MNCVFPRLLRRPQETEASITDRDLKTRLVHQVDQMEAAAGTSGFAAEYKDFIGLAADHMTVFTPFLPALTQFLT